jgi:predicted nuclease of predicted toxin-antitoxin system
VRILADESVAFPVIFAMRAAGHDVTSIAEVAAGSPDEAVLDRGLRESRVVVTEDRDFGALVYQAQKPSPGVVFVRGFPEIAHRQKCSEVVEALRVHADSIVGTFIVVSPGQVRIRSDS